MRVVFVSVAAWILLMLLFTGCTNQPPADEPSLIGPETSSPPPTGTQTPGGPGPRTLPETPTGLPITAGPAETLSSPVSVTNTGSPPIARFTGDPASGTAPLEVRFVDRSTGSPTSWMWEFGDGNTSARQNPVHVYQAAGTYTVRLNASNAGGSNIERKVYYITVNSAYQPPGAAFTATPPTSAQPTTVEFFDRSTGPPASWEWDFGDGAGSDLQNPVHTYPGGGTFVVTLRVSNSEGNSSISGRVSFGTPSPFPSPRTTSGSSS
jgi:PKD repeat protein